MFFSEERERGNKNDGRVMLERRRREKNRAFYIHITKIENKILDSMMKNKTKNNTYGPFFLGRNDVSPFFNGLSQINLIHGDLDFTDLVMFRKSIKQDRFKIRFS